MILIGYSGHAFVAYGILTAAGKKVTGYCDNEQKQNNPFSLQYLGKENSDAALNALASTEFFIAIGDNGIREKIYHFLAAKNHYPSNAVHPAAVIDPAAMIAAHGVMIAANASVNPLANIGTGVICNTACVIEHECIVGNFAHIGPGAVLCGNVKVGSNSFVGANAVIKQGVIIGNNVIIGAGAVVLKDVPDNVRVMGVPAQIK